MADYQSKTSDGKCVFCEIIRGNIQTPGIFWDDDSFIAFLSIYPSVKGFAAVMPKKHYGSDVLAMPDDVLQKFIIAAKKVSGILLKNFDDVGRIGLIMEGTGVDHAHIKLVPMHGTGHMKRGIWKQYLGDQKVFFEKYEGFITSVEGPEADPGEIRKLAEQLKQRNQE